MPTKKVAFLEMGKLEVHTWFQGEVGDFASHTGIGSSWQEGSVPFIRFTSWILLARFRMLPASDRKPRPITGSCLFLRVSDIYMTAARCRCQCCFWKLSNIWKGIIISMKFAWRSCLSLCHVCPSRSVNKYDSLRSFQKWLISISVSYKCQQLRSSESE